MNNKLKAVWSNFKQNLLNFWNRNSIFIILIAPIALAWKFRDMILDFALKSAKRLMSDAKESDAILRDSAEEANNKANQLLSEAKAVDRPKVDEDWHKK